MKRNWFIDWKEHFKVFNKNLTRRRLNLSSKVTVLWDTKNFFCFQIWLILCLFFQCLFSMEVLLFVCFTEEKIPGIRFQSMVLAAITVFIYLPCVLAIIEEELKYIWHSIIFLVMFGQCIFKSQQVKNSQQIVSSTWVHSHWVFLKGLVQLSCRTKIPS